MQIRWTTRAADDLDSISTHIAEDNPRAALDVGRRLYEGIMGLAEFPERGRMGLRQDTRELVFARYLTLRFIEFEERSSKSFASGMAHRRELNLHGPRLWAKLPGF